MKNKLPSVLVISSGDPFVGPGIVGLNHYNSLKSGGLDVDFLTKYPVDNHPEFISVYDKKPAEKKVGIIDKILSRLSCDPLKRQKADYCFFYKKEIDPEVPVDLVVSKIKKEYDVVYILFWQGLLSFQTIEGIYNKLHCQIQFRCVDYSPITGGCHFFGDCQNYKTGCGCCPGIRSKNKNDFTRWNIEFRKHIYEKVKPIVKGNSYMNTFFKQSTLLKNYDRCEVVLPLVDNNVFRPKDRDICRKKYNIPDTKRFLLFAGSQNLNEPRKGIHYLLESLKLFYSKLSDEERKRVLLVLAGKDIESIKNNLYFDYLYLGYVKQNDLPDIYSMSDVYLSPSINDAGPSMVNQALSCGTPVVAFEMGTALDVIKGQRTGYCAKLKDAVDFAKGIKTIFNMPKDEYQELRNRCRDVAVFHTSSDAHVKKFLDIYERYM